MGEGCDPVCLHCFVLTLYSYFFDFLFEWREDLYAHVQLSGTSFFLLQSHFLVLGAKHCEIFMYLFFLLKCAKI